MNNLEKIQKTMKVFQTLTKIVMGFSFVAIAFTLVVGSVSLMADKLPFGELLQRLLIEADRTIDNREIGIALLCESVVLVFGAIEAICVCRYFKLELSEGNRSKKHNEARNTLYCCRYFISSIFLCDGKVCVCFRRD